MSSKITLGKAYGSIGHLPGSRLGSGDHSLSEKQASYLTHKCRKGDRVIVTEKLDGACVGVLKKDGAPVPIIRAGYGAHTSKYEHLRLFGEWVRDNSSRFDPLPEGHRIMGEWMGMAHGTIYHALREPFVPFDLMVEPMVRLTHDEMTDMAHSLGLSPAHVISDGPAISVDDVMERLAPSGNYGAQDGPEGAVWRMETKGKFNFLGKYVRPDKVDGLYIPGIHDQKEPIWLWRPEKRDSREPT